MTSAEHDETGLFAGLGAGHPERLCPGCMLPNAESIVGLQTQGEASSTLKSCPNCSSRRGTHQFYRLSDFDQREQAPGLVLIESWCTACRQGLPPRSAAYSCPVPSAEE